MAFTGTGQGGTDLSVIIRTNSLCKFYQVLKYRDLKGLGGCLRSDSCPSSPPDGTEELGDSEAGRRESQQTATSSVGCAGSGATSPI